MTKDGEVFFDLDYFWGDYRKSNFRSYSVFGTPYCLESPCETVHPEVKMKGDIIILKYLAYENSLDVCKHF